MIKNNYHTHMRYCNHAQGEVEDYILKAIELGFDEIGMTDHAPILESFMTKEEYDSNWCEQNMKLDIMEKYLDDLDYCKKKYGNKIKILSGFETEFLPDQIEFYKFLRGKVDYLNLGVHYYKYNGKVLNSYDDIDYITLRGYVDACIDGMKTGLFNTLVHPDLFMFNYKNVNGERKFDAQAIAATRQIIEAAIKYNVYLEVNANGINNSIKYGSGNDWLYPYLDFWKIANEYKDLKIIIGADAHKPEAMANEHVQIACDFCIENNINILEKMEINH